MSAPALRGDAVGDADWGAWVDAVRDDLELAVEQTLRYLRGLPSYDGVPEDARRTFVVTSYSSVLDGIGGRRQPGPGDEPPFEGHGEVRGRAGVDVSDMLAAFRNGLDTLFGLARRHAPDSPQREAMLLEFLELGMRWTDFAMLAVVRGHRRGELARARELQHVQTSLVRRLLAGEAAPAEARTGVSALGLDPDAAYLVVRARLDADVSVEELERHLGVDGFHGRRSGLVTILDGDVCGFVAELPRAASPVVIGVSEPLPLSGLATGAEHARRALETALALGASRGAYDLATLGLQAAVTADEALGDVLLDRYVRPLRETAGGEAILATAERYLGNDCSVDLTAKDLGVHANTVRHRLARLESVTGRSLRDFETLAELWWALQAARLRDA